MQHVFTGDHITVTYDDEVCTHAANCLRSLPAVFDTDRTPWVQANGASSEEVMATVNACPSAALQYQLG